MKMSLVFKLLGCFHVQRSHLLRFVAMEMDVRRYHALLPYDIIILIFLLILNQNQDIFKFVENYFFGHYCIVSIFCPND